MNEETDKSSVTYGTPSQGCAVKLYVDFNTMTDEQIEKLANRARGLWIKLGGKQK